MCIILQNVGGFSSVCNCLLDFRGYFSPKFSMSVYVSEVSRSAENEDEHFAGIAGIAGIPEIALGLLSV